MKTLRFSATLLVAGTIALFSSCQKDAIEPANSGITPGSAVAVTVPDGGSIDLSVAGLYASKTKGIVSRSGSVYTVANFAQGTVTAPADSTQWANVASTYYFSLSQNIGGDSAATVLFDLRFTGSANGDIYARSSAYSLAYQDVDFASATGTGTNVIAAPGGKLGINNITSNGVVISTGTGWYNYDIIKHIVSPFQPRTLILINKATGNPAWKISITSIYSGGVANAPTAATNYPYYNFKYQAL